MNFDGKPLPHVTMQAEKKIKGLINTLEAPVQTSREKVYDQESKSGFWRSLSTLLWSEDEMGMSHSSMNDQIQVEEFEKIVEVSFSIICKKMRGRVVKQISNN